MSTPPRTVYKTQPHWLMAEWLGFVEPLPPGEDMALFSDQKPSVSLSSICSLLASIFREVICSHIASFWWDQSTGREHRPNPTPSSAHSVLDCFVHGVRVPYDYRLVKPGVPCGRKKKVEKCIYIRSIYILSSVLTNSEDSRHTLSSTLSSTDSSTDCPSKAKHHPKIEMMGPSITATIP